MGRLRCIVSVLLGLTAPILARGDDIPQPVPANGQCSVPGDPGWTLQELFVWQHVCVGQAANFNEGTTYGGYLDPKRPEGLPEGRILRPAFLEKILLEDKYRKVLTRRGVKITGARLTDILDLQNAQLGHYFELSESLLEEGVDFNGLRSPYAVSLVGSNITCAHVSRTGTERSPVCTRQPGASAMNSFVMSESHLGGQLNLQGSKINGGLKMTGGQVIGQLGLGGATITGPLNLQELQIGETLAMDRDAQFGEVLLINVHVGGQLNLGGSNGNNGMLLTPKFHGPATIQGVQVSSTVHLSRGAEFDGPVSFIYSRVRQNVELAGGSFHQDVRITGTQIDGELRLGRSDHGPAKWSSNSMLSLRNTSVGAIQDFPNSRPNKLDLNGWPNKLDLNGFTYRYLGGLSGPDDPDPMINRPAEWFEGWLRKQDPYAPAPYQQLASLLRAQGKPDTADEVLYDGKQRERAQSSPLSWIGLTLSWLFIGYGYHLFRSLYWALVFLVLGFLALRFSGEGQRIRYSYDINLLAYSFDLLLPIIRLREKHYQVDLKGCVGYYFYLHKIMGYALASFLIAGLAGLTK